MLMLTGYKKGWKQGLKLMTVNKMISKGTVRLDL